MDNNGESSLKEFSKLLNQKLRHVKLAISKANLGQNKYKVDESQNLALVKAPRSKNLMKHELDHGIFNIHKSLFTYDQNAVSVIKEYNDKKKQIEEKIKKEKTIQKTNVNKDIRDKLKEEILLLSHDVQALQPLIDSKFNEKHFKPTACRNIKLPELKLEQKNLKVKSSTVNYNAIKSNYKSKDKMTVGEIFDSYNNECLDYMSSLKMPFAKLSKFVSKEVSDQMKNLMKLDDNHQLSHSDANDSVKIKKLSNSKFSEEGIIYFSPKK
jgi:hypothetical protein